MKLIGITGKAGAGKDTLAASFVERGFVKMAFADALKSATAAIAGEDEYHYHSQEGKAGFSEVFGMTRRAALQNLGTPLRDIFDEDLWVRRLLLEWSRAGKPPAVISDVRFDNEATAIRRLGGKVIEIVRPDNATLTGAESAHASEQGVSRDLLDLVIVNEGSLEQLQALSVDSILTELGGLR